MKADKQYITQITSEDLKEIAEAANIHGSDGIILSKDGDGLAVSIDKQALRMWVNEIIKGKEI